MRSDYRPVERRPIATRERRVWKLAAARLAGAGISPNAISTAGMIAAIAASAAFALTPFADSLSQRLLWLAGGIAVQVRLIANMLDGMVAIEAGRASPVGELFNEVPDRVSDAAVLIGLGYAVGGNPALGYVAACLAVFVAYVRAQGKAAGAPQQFCGPMAKPHRMAVVTAAAVLMAVAPDVWPVHGGSDERGGIAAFALLVVIIGTVVTAARRLYRIGVALRATSREEEE
jgi:phosphatidylglycerophosphate synthase